VDLWPVVHVWICTCSKGPTFLDMMLLICKNRVHFKINQMVQSTRNNDWKGALAGNYLHKGWPKSLILQGLQQDKGPLRTTQHEI
jgi:hypothetical protein